MTLGWHVQRPYSSDWITRDVARVPGAMVKLVDPDHFYPPQPFGNVPYIGRYITAKDQQYWRRGAAGAMAWVEEILPRLAATPWVSIVETVNEPIVNDPFEAQDLAEHCRMATRLLHEEGFQSAVGNFPKGCPKMDLWPTLAPMFDDADYYGRHEYNEDMRMKDDWLLLRYRMDRAELAKVGVTMPPVLITEAGIDTGGGPERGGWKATSVGEDTYARRCAEYARELERDGAVPFFYTALHWRWPSFDIDSRLSHKIVDHYLSLPAPVPEPVPDPEPEEEFDMLHYFPWRISQRFGGNASYYAKFGLAGHNGMDFAPDNYIYDHGCPILTPWSGNLIRGYSDGYGVYSYLQTPEFDVVWAHLSRYGESGWVERGAVVGYMGYSGNTEPKGQAGTHLHLGIRPKPMQLDDGFRGYVDPEPYLRSL